jgi:hypothetical protein
MDTQGNKVILYSPQAKAVWQELQNIGIAFSRREYVQKKYEDCANIFLTAYDAYIRMAADIVPRPDDGAYPYWAFASMDQVDTAGGRVMKLAVPVSEAVFFDQYDWYKVLRLSYIGTSEEDEKNFEKKLSMRGIVDPSEAVLRPFYPDIKREITGSWSRLLRHDTAIRNGDTSGVRAVQAGLWQIKKEWLID